MSPVPILLYHSIAPTSSAAYQPWTVHPSDFDDHLSLIGELGLDAMTVSDFVDARRQRRLPANPCLITFDDGRQDFADHAVPILRDHGMPSTMYVVTDHIGGTSEWLPIDEERTQPMMDWDTVRSLSTSGVEVGAHSRTHVELDVAPRRQREDEIAGSRLRLYDELGAPVRSFAYPHGYHSRHVINIVRAAGFDSAAAVNDRWCTHGESRFALSRQFVWNTTTVDDLRSMLRDAPEHHPLVARCRRAVRASAQRGWRFARRSQHLVRRFK